MISNILPTFTSLITLPMLSPSWPKCVAQSAVAQVDCRPVVCLVCCPDDQTPIIDVKIQQNVNNINMSPYCQFKASGTEMSVAALRCGLWLKAVGDIVSISGVILYNIVTDGRRMLCWEQFLSRVVFSYSRQNVVALGKFALNLTGFPREQAADVVHHLSRLISTFVTKVSCSSL